MIAFPSDKDRSIVYSPQPSPGAITSAANFTCGGVAEFKLTRYQTARRFKHLTGWRWVIGHNIKLRHNVGNHILRAGNDGPIQLGHKIDR